MENALKAGDGQNTHTRPTRFTPFHKRLALIYFDLPSNDTSFVGQTVDLLIQKHAGGHPKTMKTYRDSLAAWDLLIATKDERDRTKYVRGSCPDWLREAYELASDGGAG